MPRDVVRAEALRALERGARQGLPPTRVQNTDPMKPYPVHAKNLRPVVDVDRLPEGNDLTRPA